MRRFFHLRHREPIRFDVKRARKTRYMARRPTKQARMHQLMKDIRQWLAENYLLTCEPMERLFRLMWEEYPFEDLNDPALPD